jgi:hypothetical protein
MTMDVLISVVRRGGGPACAAVLASVLLLAAPAAQASARTRAAAMAAPKHFVAQSITWVSPARGWLLGTAQCAAGHKSCTTVLGTTDGGVRWSAVGTVASAIAHSGGQGVSEIRFGSARLGWAFGPALFESTDGGRAWARQAIPGGGKQVLALAATAAAAYAVVAPCPVGSFGSCRTPMGLWRAPISGRGQPGRWARIPIRLPANFTAVLAAFANSVYVVDPFGPGLGQPDRFYASANGRTFSARPDPCSRLLDSSLTDVVATSASKVDMLCVGNPGMSRAMKVVFRSSDGARHSASAGDASAGNQDFGIQAGLAASATGNLVVASASSGDWIYLNDSGRSAWTTALSLADGGLGWNDPVFSSSSTAWVVNGPASFTGVGLLYVTRDGGRKWAVKKL